MRFNFTLFKKFPAKIKSLPKKNYRIRNNIIKQNTAPRGDFALEECKNGSKILISYI